MKLSDSCGRKKKKVEKFFFGVGKGKKRHNALYSLFALSIKGRKKNHNEEVVVFDSKTVDFLDARQSKDAFLACDLQMGVFSRT